MSAMHRAHANEHPKQAQRLPVEWPTKATTVAAGNNNRTEPSEQQQQKSHEKWISIRRC